MNLLHFCIASFCIKCGKNFSDTLGYASCATFLFLPHFNVICDLLLNRRMATRNLFVKYTMLYEYFSCYYLALLAFLRGLFYNETIIPLAFDGYEMAIANSVLFPLVAIYHLIFNALSWNNCCI